MADRRLTHASPEHRKIFAPDLAHPALVAADVLARHDAAGPRSQTGRRRHPGLHGGPVLPDDAHARNPPLAPLFLRGAGLPFSDRIHLAIVCLARFHEHSGGAHALRRHALLLPGHPHDDPARGHRRDGHLPRLHSAHRLQPARHRRHGRPLAGGDAGAGQRVVQLRLLLRRHRRRLRGHSRQAAHPPHRPPLALDALGRAGGHRAAFGRHSRAGLLYVAVPLQSGHRVPRGALLRNRRADGDFYDVVPRPRGGAAAAHQEAHAMQFPLPVRRVPIHLQQDRRFRHPPRPRQVHTLRALREGLSDPVDHARSRPLRQAAALLHEMRRLRGCLRPPRGRVAHQGNARSARPRNGRA